MSRFKNKMLSLSLLVVTSQICLAAAAPSPSPSPSQSSTASSSVEVTPDLLRTAMLQGNYSILTGLNTLEQAKISVAAARAGVLLPGAKVGAIFDPLTSPASFALTSVSVLLPFLLPSNWFALKESDHMLEADKAAYYLLELNQYASAYAIYETIVNDLDVQEALQENYDALNEIAQDLQNRENGLQTVASSDLLNAVQAAEQAEAQLSKMKETIEQEKSSLTVILGLPLADLAFDNPVHIAPSPMESASPQQILDQGLKIAPEAAQINALVAAQNDQKWSDLFAFVSSVSLANTGVGSGNTSGTSTGSGNSLGDFALSGNVSFGFTSFPTYLLDKEKVAAIALELKNLKLTEASEIQSSLASIEAAQDQIAEEAAAEANAIEVLNIEGVQYHLGQTDLLHVLSAVSSVITARMAKIDAQADLDNQRINLHRILLTDEFAQLPQCQINGKVSGKTKVPDSGPFGWVKDIFHPSTNVKTVDQLCRPGM
jgi:outer membrane protein, multidrug efflux system